MLKPSKAWKRGIGDDADAGGSGRESDEPHPVALAHQVIGRHRTIALGQPRMPVRVVGPRPTSISAATRNHTALHACPLARFRSISAGSVRLRPDASTTQRVVVHVTASPLWTEMGVRHILGADLDGPDAATNEVDTIREAAASEFVFQPAAVDLVGRLR